MGYSYPGLNFTKLERHFFVLLGPALEKTPSLKVYASRDKTNPSVVELLVCRGSRQQSFRFRVYGLRPVRYQLETAKLTASDIGRDFRAVMLSVLGERNLRNRSGGMLSWVFQVYYSEAVVKTLS